VYRHDSSDGNRINMVQKRSKYKVCVRKAKLNYDKYETNKLVAARTKTQTYIGECLNLQQVLKMLIFLLILFKRFFKDVNNPEDFYA